MFTFSILCQLIAITLVTRVILGNAWNSIIRILQKSTLARQNEKESENECESVILIFVFKCSSLIWDQLQVSPRFDTCFLTHGA